MTSWQGLAICVDKNDTPNYESIEDTLIDLANYAIIGILVQRGQWEGIPNGEPKKRIVVLSDLQIPYHDSKAVEASIQFVKDYKPDELWCVGDELDAPEPSRWNKGMAGEYAETLQDSIDLTQTSWLVTGKH
jgi:hypothetical protein